MVIRRGDKAKQTVTEAIMKVFGNDFAGVKDKKIYVWAQDEGEKIQLAISLTAPKEPVSFNESTSTIGTNTKTNISVDSSAQSSISSNRLSPEDEAKVNELMKKLGLE